MEPRMKYYTHIIASRRRQETRRAGQVKRLLAGGKGEKKAGLSLHSSLFTGQARRAMSLSRRVKTHDHAFKIPYSSI
jgi:hypothetical protein